MRHVLFLFSLLAGTIAHGKGGEIGNAFIDFQSRIGGFEIQYPAQWRAMDLSQTVSFAEAGEGAKANYSFLAITGERKAEVVSIALLGDLLAERKPHLSWRETSLRFWRGFEAEEGGVRFVSLLLGEGQLMHFRFRAHSHTQDDMRYMLESFQLLAP